MFNLRDFILKGMKDAVGKMADHQVILNAVGWHEKGVLSEEDLAELDRLLEIRKPVSDVSCEEEATAGTETKASASEDC